MAEVNDIPVLLRGPLVRSFLANQKQVTRRTDLDKWRKAKPGDRIWFKETYRLGAWRDDGRVALDYQATPELNCKGTPWLFPPPEDFQKLTARGMRECEAAYEKDPESCWRGDESAFNWERGNSPCKWRPSIFCYKWAARCWAVIEEIREERLWDITEEDAAAEGVEPIEIDTGRVIAVPVCCGRPLPTGECCGNAEPAPEPVLDASYIAGFASTWDSINGAKLGLSWADNPIIARIQFRRIEVANA